MSDETEATRSGDLEVDSGLVIPGDEIRESASRSSGPGGQHVNKTSTRVTLRWNLRRSRALTSDQRARLIRELRSRLTTDGELIVNAGRSRSRARNRDLARERMIELVQAGLEMDPTRRPTRPSRASRARIRDAKSRRGALKKRRGRVENESD